MKLTQIVLKRTCRIHKNNNAILKTQQRFKSERYNDFTEKIDKIASSSIDEKIKSKHMEYVKIQ